MKQLHFSLTIVATILLITAGCQESQVSTESQAALQVPSPACNDQAIEAEGIVTIFDSEGSKYFTHHQYRICSSAPSLVIWGTEPEGAFVTTLIGKELTASDKQGGDKAVTRAILGSLLAAGGFLDEMGMEAGSPVKIGGIWYIPSQLVAGSLLGDGITLFENRSTGQVDMVQIVDASSGKTVTARNYNIRQFDRVKKTLPVSVDIFENPANSLTNRKMHIRYLDFNISNQ